MATITIHKAKTNLSQLIERACRGEDVVIARGAKPVVRLVPVGTANKKRVPGSLKGQITYTPDAFGPLTDKELTDLGFE
jgi:prevent-host-death family protein